MVKLHLSAKSQNIRFALFAQNYAVSVSDFVRNQNGLAVAVGLLLSLAAGRVLSQILYRVSPSDPFSLITSSLMLAAAALAACFLPARRATYVNPITALRTE